MRPRPNSSRPSARRIGMSSADSSVVGPHLAAARAGSREALGAALDHCRRFLLAAARDAVGPGLAAKGGASDLVQETYLEAQRQFPHFAGGSGGQLRAWLRRLLAHKAAHLGRHYRNTRKRVVGRERAPTPAVPALTPTPSVQAAADEELRR